MTNLFVALDAQSPVSPLAQVQPEEVYSLEEYEADIRAAQGADNAHDVPDAHLDASFEERIEDHGWPGDGSGMDDLADHNANEADAYRDE